MRYVSYLSISWTQSYQRPTQELPNLKIGSRLVRQCCIHGEQQWLLNEDKSVRFYNFLFLASPSALVTSKWMGRKYVDVTLITAVRHVSLILFLKARSFREILSSSRTRSSMLKDMKQMFKLINKKVHLYLFVKVRENWMDKLWIIFTNSSRAFNLQ